MLLQRACLLLSLYSLLGAGSVEAGAACWQQLAAALQLIPPSEGATRVVHPEIIGAMAACFHTHDAFRVN